jgi:hypothetical protein
MNCIKTNLEKKVLIIISIWLSIIIIIISIVASTTDNKFYNIGPNENLIILGIKINTYYKYIIVIVYSIFNSIIRSSNNILIGNWLTNNICDIKYKLDPKYKQFSYWTTTIYHVYTWFDWLIYYSLMLIQIDMFIIEVFCETVIANCLTKYYLSHIIPNFQRESNTNQHIDHCIDPKIDIKIEPNINNYFDPNINPNINKIQYVQLK